jgi:hypothetical protein
MPIAIAGNLVYFASLAEFNNHFGVGFEEMKKISAEEKQQQIVKKLLKFLPNERF